MMICWAISGTFWPNRSKMGRLILDAAKTQVVIRQKSNWCILDRLSSRVMISSSERIFPASTSSSVRIKAHCTMSIRAASYFSWKFFLVPQNFSTAAMTALVSSAVASSLIWSGTGP